MFGRSQAVWVCCIAILTAVGGICAAVDVRETMIVPLLELADRDTPEADQELRAAMVRLVVEDRALAIEVLAALVEKGAKQARSAADLEFVPLDKFAAQALGRLRLADAPVRGEPETYTPNEVEQWRQWARQRGAGRGRP